MDHEIWSFNSQTGQKVRIFVRLENTLDSLQSSNSSTSILNDQGYAELLKVYTSENIPNDQKHKLIKMPQPRFGQIIKMIRKAKKLKQKDFFSATNVKQSNLSNIENGRINPRIFKREQILKGLGIK